MIANHWALPGTAWMRLRSEYLALLPIGCLLLSPVALLAQSKEYQVAPTPDWVKPISARVEDKIPVSQLSDGLHYVLSDHQIRVLPSDQVEFRHFVEKAVNGKGVEEVANISMNFDPSFQSLTLHSINVIRNGHAISRLADAKVRILQRETELENRIFNGGKTANVFLDDVRIGDAVEYSYSVRGVNPVYGRHHFGTLQFQFQVPVARLYSRVRIDGSEQIETKNHNTALKATETVGADHRDYEWDLKQVPPLATDGEVPAWYDPYPAVDWGDYRDWASVAHWAVPLYQVPGRLSAELESAVDRIAKTQKTPAGRTVAALHFVQSEVRYLGVEIGPGSNAPNPPSLVFHRRFGDCKDKALLLVSMLDRLGIPARAALVNTTLQRGIAERQSSPSEFDHAIVRALVNQRSYWLDPTLQKQRGDLEHLYQPDYGLALIVDPATDALSPMSHPAAVPQKIMHAIFDARKGFDKPVHYSVITTRDGSRAEGLNETLNSTSGDNLQKQYLDYYAKWYSNISVEKPLEVSVDDAANSITTTEHYVIKDFSHWSKSDNRHEVSISVPDMETALSDPSTINRNSPYDNGVPYQFYEQTIVLLPETWPLENVDHKIEDSAFVFEQRVANEGLRLVFTDQYQSRTAVVMPRDMAGFVAHLDRAREIVGYQLFWKNPAAAMTSTWKERLNWTVSLLGVLILVGWCSLAMAIYRRDPATPSVPLDPELEGIRGWLILPAIGTIWGVISALKTLTGSLAPYSLQSWTNLTTPTGSAYDPIWEPILLFELSWNLAMVVFSILLLVMFFQRRRGVPRLFIGYVMGIVAMELIDRALASQLALHTQSDWTKWGANAFRSGLWSAYFLLSKRVKSTFTKARASPKKADSETLLQVSPEQTAL